MNKSRLKTGKFAIVVAFVFLSFVSSVSASSSLTYRGTAQDSVDRTTYSYTSKSIGTADSTRYVVVAMTASAGSQYTISSCSIGGISGVVSAIAQNTNNVSGFCTANVPTGTTATISVTYSGTMAGSDIVWWTDLGYSSATPISSVISSSVDAHGALLGLPDGGIFAVSKQDLGNTPPQATWTNVTEDLDAFDYNTNSISAGSANVSGLSMPDIGVAWVGTEVRPVFSVISLAPDFGGGGGGCTEFSCLTGTESVATISETGYIALITLFAFSAFALSFLLFYWLSNKIV